MKEKLKAAALRFVNEARKDQGLAPLSELRKGRPGNAYFCPIAQSIAGKTAASQAGVMYFAPVKFLGIRLGQRFRDKKADELTAKFVSAFDAGFFPELIKGESPPWIPPTTPSFVPTEWEREKDLV